MHFNSNPNCDKIEQREQKHGTFLLSRIVHELIDMQTQSITSRNFNNIENS